MNPDREAERPSPPVAGDYSLGHRPARDRVKRGEIDRELAVTLDHHRRQPAKQQVGEIVVLDQQPSPAGAPTRLSQDQAILLIVEVTNRGKPADHTRRFDVSEVSLPAPQAGRSAADCGRGDPVGVLGRESDSGTTRSHGREIGHVSRANESPT